MKIKKNSSLQQKTITGHNVLRVQKCRSNRQDLKKGKEKYICFSLPS